MSLSELHHRTKLTHWKKISVTNLELGDKVDVGLSGELLPDPLDEHLGEALVDLQPSGVEAQAQRSAVGAVMPEIIKGEKLN